MVGAEESTIHPRRLLAERPPVLASGEECESRGPRPGFRGKSGEMSAMGGEEVHGIGSACFDAARMGLRDSAREGKQSGARQTATWLFMFLARKQSLLTQFMKFGVDDQGTIVPILKRNKGNAGKPSTEYRPLQIPLKPQFAER